MADYRQWLNSLPEPNGVLKNLQTQGRASLANLGMPTNTLEEWRLTDLNCLQKILNLPLYKPNRDYLDEEKQKEWAQRPKNGFRLVIDSQTNPLEDINLPNGIRPLTSAEVEKLLVQRSNQYSSSRNWQVAINNATATNFLALKIEGQNLPPLELIMQSDSGAFIPTRIALIVEDKTKLNLLQVALGAANSAQSHLVEIYLGKGAELNHGLIAFGIEEANMIANLFVEQKTSSHYSFTSVQHGWSLSRLESLIVQTNGHANTTLKGLQVSSKKQQIATHSRVKFEGPQGCLEQLQKSAATDNSHCIFNGSIQVPQLAQKTNAAQLSRNLLMSNRARIDTKPELEIIADDVRCTHGATISQLQEEEVFYMRSRGITTEQATSLLLKGYCKEILDNLPVESHRWEILDKLLKSVKR